MNKNTSVTMAAAVAGILTLAVLTVGLHQAFAGGDDGKKQQKQEEITKVAVGGNGGSGGAGGAGGEAGAGGNNVNKLTEKWSEKASVDQKANGGDADGGHGGNANGGNADILNIQKEK
jgi:hypothetical protein